MTLERVVRTLATSPHLLVMLDYDGTLTPIADHPNMARLDSETVRVLTELLGLPATTVAVVSGRGLTDLRAHIDIPGLVLVGGHGAETAQGVDIDDDRRHLLDQVIADLEEIARLEPGAFVEVKPTSAALHVRQVVDGGERLIESALEVPGRLPGVRTLTGKQLVEFTVSQVDKGGAVGDLRSRHPGGIACYIGDDVTDEDAFIALQPSDIGIKVGTGETAADLCLAVQEEVRPFLEAIVDTRRDISRP